MKKLILLLLVTVVSFTGLACSCQELDELTRQEINEATDVFIGKVISADTLKNSAQLNVLIAVTETIKGREVKERTITTNISSAACGLTLKVGQEWFFFVTEYRGELRVNMCGRHLNLTKPRFRWCKKKRGLIALNKTQYRANLQKVEAYKQLILATEETL